MVTMLRKNKAITLLELMLSLAIIAIILVMATRYYDIVHSSEQTGDASAMIQAIRAGSQRWLLSNENFTGISVPAMQNLNLLPTTFGTNPWGGTIKVDPAPNDTSKIQINLTNIPAAACENLSARFSTTAISVNCTGHGNFADFIGVF